MAIFQETRCLSYPRGELFELVADVERYPEFLPGWQQAQVTGGTVTHKHVKQTLGMGPVQADFHSRAEFSPPDMIHIQANDGPFRQLDIHWQFLASDEHQTEVTLKINVELKAVPFRQFLESWFSQSTALILTAFERRARSLYGQFPQPQS